MKMRIIGFFVGASSTLAFGAAAMAGSAETTEPSGSAPGGPGCAEIVAVLDALDAFTTGFVNAQPDVLEPLIMEIPELAAAAVAAAPPEIAGDVATWIEPFPDIATALTNADLTDIDAAAAAVSEIDTEASDAAGEEVVTWAEDNCGWASAASDPFADAPEPPDCETLDAAAAAEAAGIDVDVTDLDGSGDFSLPGFWTKSCSYDNGAMSLSTLSFNTVEAAEQFYADNLDTARGVIVDFDLGTLPESSLIIETGVAVEVDASAASTEQSASAVPRAVQVAVFEASIPFSVSFTGDDIDPSAVVAAAEALLFAPTGAEPPVSVVTTTA